MYVCMYLIILSIIAMLPGDTCTNSPSTASKPENHVTVSLHPSEMTPSEYETYFEYRQAYWSH